MPIIQTVMDGEEMLVQKRLGALSIDALIAGVWWLVVSYAISHYSSTLLAGVASISTFVAYTIIRLVETARENVSPWSLWGRHFLAAAAIRAVGVAALTGGGAALRSHGQSVRVLLVASFLGVVLYRLVETRRSPRSLVLMLLPATALILMYLASLDIVPLGNQIAWALLGLSVLILLLLPERDFSGKSEKAGSDLTA